MHLTGEWKRGRGEAHGEKTCAPLISLSYSDDIHVVTDERRSIYYMGEVLAGKKDILKCPSDRFHELSGMYVYVAMDHDTGVTFIGTDAIGFAPLYYSLTRDRLLFGSNVSLLKYRVKARTPDIEAWDEVLNYGDIVGDKTILKEIKRALPGTRIRIADDRVEFDTIWTPQFPDYVPDDEYITRNNELLCESLELTRDCERPIVIPLSGGLDSRRLAVSAKHIDLPVTFAVQQVAHGGTSDEDSVLARRIAKYLDTDILFVDFPPHAVYYNDILRRDYWLGWETSGHVWSFELMRNIRPSALVLDGIVGDLTVTGHYYHAHPDYVDCYKDLDKVARILVPSRDVAMKFDVKLLGSTLYDRVRQEFSKLDVSPQALNYFYLLNHTRRNTASLWQVMYLYCHAPYAPYLHAPFFLQSVSINPRVYRDHLYQSVCTSRLNSRVAAFPSTRGKLPPDVLVDWEDFISAREVFNLRFSNIRKDVYDYFPEMRYKILGHKAAKKFRIQRASWLLGNLARFSLFLDWLEYDEEPAGPVANGVSPFLRERMTP